MNNNETDGSQYNYIVYFSAPHKYNSAELNGQITNLWNKIVLAANPITTSKTKGFQNRQLKLEDGNSAFSSETHSEFLTATFNDVFEARDVALQLVQETMPKFLPVTVALVENNTAGRILRGG